MRNSTRTAAAARCGAKVTPVLRYRRTGARVVQGAPENHRQKARITPMLCEELADAHGCKAAIAVQGQLPARGRGPAGRSQVQTAKDPNEA